MQCAGGNTVIQTVCCVQLSFSGPCLAVLQCRVSVCLVETGEGYQQQGQTLAKTVQSRLATEVPEPGSVRIGVSGRVPASSR